MVPPVKWQIISAGITFTLHFQIRLIIRDPPEIDPRDPAVSGSHQTFEHQTVSGGMVAVGLVEPVCLIQPGAGDRGDPLVPEQFRLDHAQRRQTEEQTVHRKIQQQTRILAEQSFVEPDADDAAATVCEDMVHFGKETSPGRSFMIESDPGNDSVAGTGRLLRAADEYAADAAVFQQPLPGQDPDRFGQSHMMTA